MKRSDLFLKFLHSFSIRSQSLRIVPLRLWEPQQNVWDKITKQIDRKKKVWLIILKARREGMSTLCEGVILARVLEADHVHSLVMGSNAGNTAEIWRMASTMISHSPWRGYAKLMRREILIGKSKLTVATAATPDATRGFDLTCLHGSEVAFWQYPETLMAVLQCLPDNMDTFCFLESTPNGKVGQGKLFYEEWGRAVDGDSDFIPIFLPWYTFPRYQRMGYVFKDEAKPGDGLVLDDLGERQEYGGMEEKELRDSLKLTAPQLAWRRYAISSKCQGSLDKFASEYPTTPETAFIQSGLPYFRRHELYPFQTHISKGTKYLVRGGKLVKDPQGYLEVYVEPVEGRQYIIGSDSSFGIEMSQRSRSASQVLDMETLEQVAEYDASTPPHVQARHLDAMGRYYNTALVCPEVQSAGGGGGREIIVYLKGLNYWNIYIDTARSVDRVKYPLALVYGWETNAKTRPRMIARLREVIQERSCIIHSQRLLSQIENFGESDSGRLETLQGRDDLLMSFMIALVARSDNWMWKGYRTTMEPTDELEGIVGLSIKEVWTPEDAFKRHQERILKPPVTEAASYLEL